MSVGDRLARLLFIVPYVAQRKGVSLGELAQKLKVKVSQIESDIALLSMVGSPPLTPDHLIDLYIEDGTVYVDLEQSLSRPLQLTHEEATALVTAAQLVGSLGGLGDELERVLKKITDVLNPVFQKQVQDVARQIGIWQDAGGIEDLGLVLREAISENVVIEMDYYSTSSDELKAYRIEPIAIINHSGWEYCVANDIGAGGQEKLFRLDRVGMLEKTTTTFEPPQDLELERFRKPDIYKATSEVKTVIRFEPEAVGEAQEQFGDACAKPQDDGTLCVELELPSPVWLARFILPFGTSAEVIGPQPQREVLGHLCQKAAEAYSKKLEGV